MATATTIPTNGHSSPSPPLEQLPSDVSPQSDVFNASSVTEIKAALSRLHTQEASVTARLDALVTSQKDLSRELGRLDLMRAHIGTQTSTTRSVSHGMLSEAAGTADRISSAVRRLDLEQARVKATLEVVEQVAELKACALGVAGSMGASQDWETAAGYLNRASQVPASVRWFLRPRCRTPPSVTLDNAAESLCGLFLREFDKAVKESDGAKITRFFKLFPLIGRSEVGLDVYGRYVCQGVAARARGILNASAGTANEGFFYANTLTKLFEHIAQIIDGHGGLVERHYGPRKMGRVIERLQIEADVQGGIILDTWSDERHVDRKLMDIKSYAFTFLVQSFLPAQRPGQQHSNSPAPGADPTPEDEGVDMKEIDGLLSEMAIMLGRWSLYCRFLADTCNSPAENEGSEDDAHFAPPAFLSESSLAQKVGDKLVGPFNAMTTFFFRRSVEKAFQLDESPSGLSLNMRQPLKSEPPHITSAVDDIMYIVNKVIQQSLATSQEGVVTNVVPTLSRVLGSDFIGMTQRKMRDECYPRAAVQGGQPPEQIVIAFLVQMNNLDIAIDYIRRIVANNTGTQQQQQPTQSSGDKSTEPVSEHLRSLFPVPSSARRVAQTLQTLATSFEAKVNELLSDGIQVVFNNVIKQRLRPILADAFRDIEYQPTTTEETEYDENRSTKEIVRPRFATGWSDLLLPIARILTQQAFARLLTVTIAYMARLLEKRLWSYQGRVNPLGAARLERDISGLVSAAVDVGFGAGGATGRYRHREAFVRCVQMTLVMSMDEDEWDEVLHGGEAADVVDKLSREERIRVRGMVRRG
ncbi:hypothetical protein N7533_012696 [Penicillium manginii]|uniref:uncharacterized protein n=1 Tax=Penicillium manginii TaxID=203109 RepID=UPI002547F028|nr:uncharacterized protein N7533_012696 [Penicillium manginii]KAJ5739912.1 hypothetical protein N7533_012696 [Penicillium manginii]